MDDLLVIALAGFAAALVDGALGMGFGPTSSTILLTGGVPPVAVSAMVNIAKTVSGLAGAAAHWRQGNVDRWLVVRLAVPGAVGAVAGAVLLVNVNPTVIRYVMAALLIAAGLRILLRFSRPAAGAPGEGTVVRPRGVVAAGAVGGVTNGLVGAWGPVVTPFLLQRGVAPRLAVGSVNTAEVAVAVTAVGALLSNGDLGLRTGMLVALLAGGVVAAPRAAKVVRVVPARALGVGVGGLLVLTQVKILLDQLGAVDLALPAYALVASVVVAAGLRPRVSAALAR